MAKSTSQNQSEGATPYEALVHELRNMYRPLPDFSIEMLPSGIDPPDGVHVVVEDHSVGVPKKTLVAAFLYARQTLMSRLNDITSTVGHP